MNYHSIFISDVHLRTKWCKSRQLYAFLANNKCNNLFLVGDIIDTWNVHNGYIDAFQCRVVGEILDHPNAKLVIGNHESDLGLVNSILGDVPKFDYIKYTTLAGKRLLITHGHQFDSFRMMNHISSFRRLYNIAAMRGEDPSTRLLSRMAYYLLKKDLWYFKRKALRSIRDSDFDAIVTGHTHYPEIETANRKTFFNTGDWVSHCSALVEDLVSGELRLL